MENPDRFECGRPEGRVHHHRGKSSESLVDNEAVLAGLGSLSGQIVLDAGCGNGYMSKLFSRCVAREGRVYALDPDEVSFETLRREVDGTNITALVGDITTDTGLPESSFDLVYLCTVFHGFSSGQIPGFEREVRRILKSCGRLAIVEMVKCATPFGPPLEIRYSPEELIHVLGIHPLATSAVGEYLYLQLFENRK